MSASRVRGSIRLRGREIANQPTEAMVRAGIALVPEGRKLFPQLTVDENLAMGAYLRRDKAAIAADLAAMRTLFPRLAARHRQLAATLSGGEQQMVAIGRGIMSRPHPCLLDEPSLGLAPVLVEEIMALIKRINERGDRVLRRTERSPGPRHIDTRLDSREGSNRRFGQGGRAGRRP